MFKLRRGKTLDVLLIGRCGRSDTGAVTNLAATINDIREVLGERLGHIVVLCDHADFLEQAIDQEDVEFVLFDNLNALSPKMWLNQADILVFWESGNWKKRFTPAYVATISLLLQGARLKGQRIVFYGNDCRELNDGGRRRFRNVMRRADLVTVCNSSALSKMKEYGVRKELFCTANSAYLYPRPSETRIRGLQCGLRLDPERFPVLAICPKEMFETVDERFFLPLQGGRKPELERSARRYARQLAAYADDFIERHDGHAVLIGMKDRDNAVIGRIAEFMTHRHRSRIVNSLRYSGEDVSAVLSMAKLQVTSRYYPIVLGSAHGLPTIAVSTDGNLDPVMRELGIIDYYLDYRTNPNTTPNFFKLDEKLHELEAHISQREEAIRDRVRRNHDMLRYRAVMNRGLLQEWVDRTFKMNS